MYVRNIPYGTYLKLTLTAGWFSCKKAKQESSGTHYILYIRNYLLLYSLLAFIALQSSFLVSVLAKPQKINLDGVRRTGALAIKQLSKHARAHAHTHTFRLVVIYQYIY